MNTYKSEGILSKKVSGSKTGIDGVIYQLDDVSKTVPNYGRDQKLPETLKEVKDCKKPLSKIGGSWISFIKFDDKVYWDINEVIPQRQIPLV